VHLQTLHHPKWDSGIMHSLLVPEVVLGDLSTSLPQPVVTYSRMKFG
jgi:hypothetical protein